MSINGTNELTLLNDIFNAIGEAPKKKNKLKPFNGISILTKKLSKDKNLHYFICKNTLVLLSIYSTCAHYIQKSFKSLKLSNKSISFFTFVLNNLHKAIFSISVPILYISSIFSLKN